MNLETGVARVLYTHAEGVYEKFSAGEWSADGQHFLAAVTLSVNRLGRKELWSLPVDGGPSIRQPLQGPVVGLSLCRDGTQLALT